MLPPGLAGQRPKTAADILPPWAEPLGLRADCMTPHETGRRIVAAYRAHPTDS